MPKAHIKKGDEVVVIAGEEGPRFDKEKNEPSVRRGKVIQVLPAKNRVIVEGVNMIKKHTRKSQQHPQGAIVEREGPIHMSNVMLSSEFDARVERRKASAAKA